MRILWLWLSRTRTACLSSSSTHMFAGLRILTSGWLSGSQVLGVAFVRFSNPTDTPVTVMNLPTVVFSFVWGTVIWIKDHGRSKTNFGDDSSSQVEYRLKDWHRCWQGRDIGDVDRVKIGLWGMWSLWEVQGAEWRGSHVFQ